MFNLTNLLSSSSSKATEQETSLSDGIALVQSVFRGMGLDDNYGRTKSGGYIFERSMGSAGFYIILNKNHKIKANTITFVAPILQVPNRNREKFYRKCLELNHSLTSCSFAIFGEEVRIVSERDLKGLDADEFKTILFQVANSANELDDQLAKEFGAKMYSLGHKKEPDPDTIR